MTDGRQENSLPPVTSAPSRQLGNGPQLGNGQGRHRDDSWSGPAARPPTFGSLLRDRNFATLWISGAQSQLGDQLARVALAILVYSRTGSGVATAATYALTYLPAVVGGIVLSGLADRVPRRGLLVCCDVIRAAIFVVMALPGLPLWLLCALLIVAVLVGAPYNAAAPAVVADLFSGEAYIAAQGLRTATAQTAQLVGFAVGGFVVAAIGSRATLLLDAATFAASAVLVRVGLNARPAAVTGRRTGREQLLVGLRMVGGDRRLKVLLALAWLNAWWIVPEGLAAPYADSVGGGAVAVGVLLAAAPTGNVVGVVVLTRWVPTASRARLLSWLVPLSGLPLLGCAARPPLAVAAVLWAASGVFTAYLVVIVTEFVAIVPSDVRAQTIGLASSSLLAAQGLGLLLAAGMVAVWSASTSVALAGGAGSLLAAPLALAWRRASAR